VRLGVFGGTFDPPHLGHLILAAEAADQLQLDKVLWVITPDPPHKQFQALRPVDVRLKLLNAAIGCEPGFEISLVDLARPGPQYAVDTLAILTEQNPAAAIYYLIGGDSLHDLPTWYEPERLLALVAGLGVMRRPGDTIDLAALNLQLPGLQSKINLIESPLLDISSRDLRERIRTGRHFRHFLPTAVWKLIQANGYYSESPSGATY
jgi:nicotinate-nucleotide adenylyltransferase